MSHKLVGILIVLAALALSACQEPPPAEEAEAEAFIERAESELLAAWQDSARAS